MGMSRDIYTASVLYGGKRFVASSDDSTGAGDAMALCLSTLQEWIVEGKIEVRDPEVVADWAYEVVDYGECDGECDFVVEKFEDLAGKVETLTLFECTVEDENPKPTLETANIIVDEQYAEEFRCGRDPRD